MKVLFNHLRRLRYAFVVGTSGHAFEGRRKDGVKRNWDDPAQQIQGPSLTRQVSDVGCFDIEDASHLIDPSPSFSFLI
jgi:hypothetical protein